MADNVDITPGSGATVAADELVDGTLGSVKVQFLKVMDGTLDSTNKWIINSSGYGSMAVADGADVAQGAQADTAWSGSGGGSLVAVLKAIWTRLRGGQATMANSLPVTLASDQTALSVDISSAAMQALVSDLPQSYSPDAIEPISITSEGRVRVSSVSADIDRCWTNVGSNPYFQASMFGTEIRYV